MKIILRSGIAFIAVVFIVTFCLVPDSAPQASFGMMATKAASQTFWTTVTLCVLGGIGCLWFKNRYSQTK